MKPQLFDDHPVPYGVALEQGRFRGIGAEVVDGDTFDCWCDLGFYSYAYERIRLAGVDTPEIYGVSHDSDEYRRGIEAKELVQGLLLGEPVLVETHEEQTFGRFVGSVWVRDEGWQNLASILRSEGFSE